jgi:hypothetical protein
MGEISAMRVHILLEPCFLLFEMAKSLKEFFPINLWIAGLHPLQRAELIELCSQDA